MTQVDVLIPVYNAASTIESALRSICDQTVRDIRLIVVDDGSTDATPQVLQRLAAQDDRIHVITKANGGIVDALNVALAASTAPLLARHDADDIAFPHRLRQQIDYLEAQPDCAAVACNAFHIDVQGRRTGYVTQFTAVVTGDPFNSPSLEPYLLHPFLLTRRTALVTAGGYRYAFHSEDTDLYWRLSNFGRLANLTAVLGEYRIHADSVSSSSILNGRISAVNSQLAAVSEQRRRAGKMDITFDKGLLTRYHAAHELDAIVDIAAETLDADERRFLATATATKLLELSSYRPYRMSDRDLTVIRSTIERHYAALSRGNRLYVIFKLILGRNRLKRDWREAMRLVPWKVMPRASLDMCIFISSLARRRIHRRSNRPSTH